MRWPQVEITSDHTTGEVSYRYSMTPQEFASALQAEGECVYVTSKACHECYYFPESRISSVDRQALTTEEMRDHHIPECICVTAAYFRGQAPSPLPEFIICYEYYYQNCYRNRYLAALREADLVTFVDTTGLPSLRESGLKASGGWDFETNGFIDTRRMRKSYGR